ncbi:filaggrin-like [Podarcis raffonei]|uniref:filaggrin-like n=1 Tax=Podarcis raffonei TaxID=65483 RepID=UPI00232923EE|nr:filaggrin-like [Podarcis raffonei]
MTSHSRDFRSRSNSSSFASPGGSFGMRRERSCSPSSRYGACSSPMGLSTSRNNFSSSSLTGHSRCSYPKVSVNKRLLTPLHLDIDPSLQEIKTKEKDEIRTLNNQFAALIGKVQSLEQHNQVLLTRWNFLKEQDNSLSELDIKLLYDQYMNRLNLEVRSIDAEKEQLDSELDEVLDAMDAFRNKYEEEINKRTGMEFTFMTLKKDLDNGFLHKTELEAKLSGLLAVAELMKNIYEQELEEVMSQIKDISVVVGIDNNRYNPDPHRIVEDVRAQYEDLAIRSWEELEALTRSKLNEREVLSAKYGDHLLQDRRVIAELNIQIQKMRSCIVSLKSQCLRLEENIKEVGAQGESALNDAKAKLAKLEEALHSARQDLAQLVKEYQELMNIKLALDIEILTYRKLMEGEEISMESPQPAVISRIYSMPKHSSSNTNITTTSHAASVANEVSTDNMNRSRSSLESGLSRSHSGGSRGFSNDDFSRSHSNRSGGPSEGISEASRSHSSIRKGTLESSTSRSSSRSGNFADIEDTMNSSVSRSQGHGSGSYRSHSNRSGDNLEGSLSRSQSNRSVGLTDSVFARTNSGASEGVQAGNYSRSQSNRSGDLADKVFARTHSGESEGVSGGSLSRSYSGTSASYVEGDLSRSESNENEIHGNYGSEACVEPSAYRMNSAEDGGVPVGGMSRSNSRASSYVSGGSQSRIQNDSSYGNEGYAEPIVSRTNSAEDGGVPVGGTSRSNSRASSYASGGSLSRIQNDNRHGSEEYAEPTVSRTNSAEDGGVPVGGTSRSNSRASSYASGGSLSRNESDVIHGNEGYAEPIVSRTNSAEDGGVPVGGTSRSNSRASSYASGGSLSRNESDVSHGSEGYAEPTVSRTNSAEDSGVPVGSISRSHSGASSYISVNSPSRSYSDEKEAHDSEGSAESAVSRTNSAEDGGVPVGGVSRSSSKASRDGSQGGSFRSRSGGFADTVFTRARTEGTQEGNLSRCSSGTNATFIERSASGSHSSGGRGTSEGSLSRSQSSNSGRFVGGGLSRDHSSESKESHSDRSGRLVDDHSYSEAHNIILESGLCRSTEAKGDSFARSHSGESGGPVETSTPIWIHRRSGDAIEPSFSRSHSGESGSFKPADFYRSSSEVSRGASEASLSRSSSKETENIPEGTVSRSYSYRCAVISPPNLSRTESEDAPESSLSRSHSSEKENVPEVGLSRSYSGRSEEALVDNLCISHSGGHEGFPESGPLVDRGLSRSQSDEPAIGIPVCMVYEFSTDEHHHLPAGEICYYVESGSME